jgi:uncharacterized damage-inducible protein DinB
MIEFTHPPHHAAEKDTLVGFLASQRAILAWKLDGLSEQDARRPIVPSGTSMLGLVKHMAWVERWWFVDFIGGGSPAYPWSDEDPDADWRIEEGETIGSITQLYAEAIAEADVAIAAAESLEITRSVRDTDRSLRWTLVHMIEETARHAGHADILREIIDGTTGYLPGG